MLNINWNPLIYGAATLAAAWFVIHKLEFSPEKLISTIAKEMRLLTKANWTRAAINGLAVVLFSVILLLYFFFDRVKQLLEFVHNLEHKQHSGSAFELAYCLTLFVVLALLSARSAPEK
jgi:lysylphosphatidylglycerol synthetase-like protein (DUF2156 family)